MLFSLRQPKDESGAAAVEFALVVSLLMMIVFGIIQFGQFFSQYQVFEAAAREGARVASTRDVNGLPTPSETAIERVREAADPYADRLPDSISVSTTCTDANVGDAVTVSWDQPFDISLPLLPPINVTKSIEGVFRCE